MKIYFIEKSPFTKILYYKNLELYGTMRLSIWEQPMN